MLDGVSLDQLRTFIAAADEGSFSAAGRRLRRAQSVVSQTLANLEGQLGVKLFERGARFTALSDQGRALLTEARAVAGHVDLFKARAKGLAGGLEPDLSVVTDAMFPIAPFIGAVSAFHERFAPTALRFYVESWGTVAQHVLDGRSSVGVGTSMTPALPRLTQEPLLTVGVPLVVSPRHPLASHRAPIPTAIFAEHIQLVHSESSTRSPAVQHRVLSPQTWLLTDLGAKHAFIRAGFGFGALPLHIVEADLASGALVQIVEEGAPPEGHMVTMLAVYRTDSPPGPAGRWFIDRLKRESAGRLQREAILVDGLDRSDHQAPTIPQPTARAAMTDAFPALTEGPRARRPPATHSWGRRAR
jgi:DNA-binding transcriptional LysR family regulator